MNLLRQTNFCTALKSYHRLNLLSISLPSVSLHSDSTKNRFQVIKTCGKTTSYNHLSQSLRNKKQLDVFQRASSSNVISPKNDLLSNLQNSIDPYKRLVRLDRPIGKSIYKCCFFFLSHTQKTNISFFFFIQKDRGFYFGHAVGVLR